MALGYHDGDLDIDAIIGEIAEEEEIVEEIEEIVEGICRRDMREEQGIWYNKITGLPCEKMVWVHRRSPVVEILKIIERERVVKCVLSQVYNIKEESYGMVYSLYRYAAGALRYHNEMIQRMSLQRMCWSKIKSEGIVVINIIPELVCYTNELWCDTYGPVQQAHIKNWLLIFGDLYSIILGKPEEVSTGYCTFL